MLTLKAKLIAAAVVLSLLAGMGTFAGCEHKAANKARYERDVARAANAAQLVTIGTQDKALKAWKALHRTPEEIAVILGNAQKYVDEIGRLEKQVRLYRDGDKNVVECVKLLQVAYATCPGRFAILHQFAHPDGNENH